MSSPADRDQSRVGTWQALLSAGRRVLSPRSLFWVAIIVVVVLSQPEYPKHLLYLLASLCWFSPRRPAAWALLTALGAWNHHRFFQTIDPRAMVLLITSAVGLAVGWRNLTFRRGRAVTVGRLLTVAVLCFYSDYYASAEVLFLVGVWCMIYGKHFLQPEDDLPEALTDSRGASRSAS